jgi:hypothetical protein
MNKPDDIQNYFSRFWIDPAPNQERCMTPGWRRRMMDRDS